ncbi:MAG: hypothetical protein AAGA03_12430 [Planctomycetota bacterium]
MVPKTPFAVLIGILAFAGCGGGDVAQDASEPSLSTVTAAKNAAPVITEMPEDVVSQFLDQIRRGGENSVATQFLTAKAQSELKLIGRDITQIGSPEVRYSVTRSQTVPGDPKSALVHSVWSAPDQADTQVVWAVEQEAGHWRISGLAMAEDAESDPVIIDFENGPMMARLLSAEEAAQSIQR